MMVTVHARGVQVKSQVHVAELVHINKVGVRTSVTATVTAVHDWHRTPCR
jgi:hypothetical protein